MPKEILTGSITMDGKTSKDSIKRFRIANGLSAVSLLSTSLGFLLGHPEFLGATLVLHAEAQRQLWNHGARSKIEDAHVGKIRALDKVFKKFPF